MTNRTVPIARGDVDNKGYHLQCPRCDYRAYGRSNATDEDTVTKGCTREYVDHFIKEHTA